MLWRSAFRKHASDFIDVVCPSQGQRQQDSRLLRVERIGSDITQLIVFVACDDAAGSRAGWSGLRLVSLEGAAKIAFIASRSKSDKPPAAVKWPDQKRLATLSALFHCSVCAAAFSCARTAGPESTNQSLCTGPFE